MYVVVEPPRQPVGQPAGISAVESAGAAADRTDVPEDLESITEVDEDNLTHSASDASVSVSEIDNKHRGTMKHMLKKLRKCGNLSRVA